MLVEQIFSLCYIDYVTESFSVLKYTIYSYLIWTCTVQPIDFLLFFCPHSFHSKDSVI